MCRTTEDDETSQVEIITYINMDYMKLNRKNKSFDFCTWEIKEMSSLLTVKSKSRDLREWK